MLFPQPKELPDLCTTTLDEILAIGIRRLVMDHELDDLLGPVVATVALDQAINRRLDLKQLGARPVFEGQVEE